MRIGMAVVVVGLLGACKVAEPAPAPPVVRALAPECSSLPANFVVGVGRPGHYEMPTGVPEVPRHDECPSAYIVDFVSTGRRMSSFRPDPDWLAGITSATSCVDECGGVEYQPFTAKIDLFSCSSPASCSNDQYDHHVGTMDALTYDDVGILSAGRRCVLRPWPSGPRPVPVAKDAFGVRMVVQHTIVYRREDDPVAPCDVGNSPNFPLPPLAYTASGTAGFLEAGKVGESSRPEAKAVR